MRRINVLGISLALCLFVAGCSTQLRQMTYQPVDYSADFSISGLEYFDSSSASWVRTGQWDIKGSGGQVVLSKVYAEGVEEGSWREYHPHDGSLAVLGSMVNGVPAGIWRAWHENGNPRYLMIYSDSGEELFVRGWDESGGEVLVEGQLVDITPVLMKR